MRRDLQGAAGGLVLGMNQSGRKTGASTNSDAAIIGDESNTIEKMTRGESVKRKTYEHALRATQAYKSPQ